MKWLLVLTMLVSGCVNTALPPTTPSAPPTAPIAPSPSAPTPLELAAPQKQKTYTLILAWNPVVFQGHPTMYQLGWGTDTSYASLSPVIGATNYQVTGLSYGTLYYFAVRSIAFGTNFSIWSAPLRYSLKQSSKGPVSASTVQP